MTVEKKMDGDTLTLSLSGRLDTTTAPDLEKVIVGELPDIQKAMSARSFWILQIWNTSLQRDSVCF